jgi:hypothetical protein
MPIARYIRDDFLLIPFSVINIFYITYYSNLVLIEYLKDIIRIKIYLNVLFIIIQIKCTYSYNF